MTSNAWSVPTSAHSADMLVCGFYNKLGLPECTHVALFEIVFSAPCLHTNPLLLCLEHRDNLVYNSGRYQSIVCGPCQRSVGKPVSINPIRRH